MLRQNSYQFPETIGAMGGAARQRRRGGWARRSAPLPSGIGTDYYRGMVSGVGTLKRSKLRAPQATPNRLPQCVLTPGSSTFSEDRFTLALTMNRGIVPGSAGVSPASSLFRLPTGRRDAGAPKRFMRRAGVISDFMVMPNESCFTPCHPLKLSRNLKPGRQGFG
jgi:hypothetical protein